MIGVVIPYFQRTPGLLTRALLSVANQHLDGLRIYVADDGSPRPAEAEVAHLPSSFAHQVVVLRQANLGPAAARNRALDGLDDDIHAVAFLDSDDDWRSDHLAHAATALAAGAEFYFADHQREGEAETRFGQCDYRPDGAPLSIGEGLYWCDARAVFRAVVERSPVGTSTVVVARATIGATRFPPHLRSAGEDSLFWLELLSQGPAVACGVSNEAAYGRGVSIFSHRSWGDARSLRTTLDEMRSQQLLRGNFPLSPDLRARSVAQSRRLDLSFCANLLACGRRLRWDALGLAWGYVSHRPWALLRIPEAMSQALQRARR
jgi:succinoglycan biosynthesis protein ExoW